MALFGKKEGKKPTTLEEVRKAYEDLSEDDKKAFHQSIADRVHESIAAQEEEHGQEDSQSAEAREHEALGEEHAEGDGDTQELHEEDDTAEEKAEDARDADGQEEKADSVEEIVKGLSDRLSALESSIGELNALRERLQAYEEEQRQSFGLPGKTVGGVKDMHDMTAGELKEKILSGQNK